jgi:N-ethylmaleimide reductase
MIKKMLNPYIKGNFSLKNHLVMAPMTRSRATGNLPNDLMAEYYGQRTGAGLIITEGTAPTKEALGYPRIPGIFNQAQIDGWKKTTSVVHKDGSKIFCQLMHTGRIGHNDNLPEGIKLFGVSVLKAAGQIFTDTLGLQDHSMPVALTTEGIQLVIEGFTTAAKNAMAADFDGVELHAANGYLPEQFLNPNVNDRTDEYGGSIEKRAKFILDVIEKISGAIGKDKTGIRISPFSVLGDLQAYGDEATNDTYVYLAKKLSTIGIAYMHISLNPDIPQKTLGSIRSNFKGTLILSSGLTPETAEKALYSGAADLVGFGRSFLANPDFDKRLEKPASLNPIDVKTLYSAGATGYTDYPVLQ